jgi:hypothetical protein
VNGATPLESGDVLGSCVYALGLGLVLPVEELDALTW